MKQAQLKKKLVPVNGASVRPKLSLVPVSKPIVYTIAEITGARKVLHRILRETTKTRITFVEVISNEVNEP